MVDLNTVLLVDDDPTQIAILTAYFGSLRVPNILSANDGAVATKIVAEKGNEIDLVVSDLSMPNVDGLEFLRLLKEQKYTGGVVLVSSFSNQIIENAAKLGEMHKLNVVSQIRKPLTKKALDDAFAREVFATEKTSAVKTSEFSKTDLKYAIKNNSILPYYQPKIAMLTGKVIGAEALARWILPSGEKISPTRFVPVAEKNGLIEPITFAIFNRVLKDIQDNYTLWKDKKIAVNLPTTMLSNVDFPNQIQKILEGTKVKPSSICFEVTETGILEFDPRTIEVLTRLKLAGFDLSIDDFGTGASNIANLRIFPYSELKIDQSFINNIQTDAFSAETVRSSISLARQLDMRIVAEGVENKQVLEVIKAKGIDQAQGYHISRPIPAEDLNYFFENAHTWMAGKNALEAKQLSSKVA